METVDLVREQELLSLEDAAEFLCVSKSTMYRLLDQGKLRGMKAGKQWRFRKDDLLAYMQRGPAAQALANVPITLLDDALAFFADALARAGAAPAAEPVEGEAGKITRLVEGMMRLIIASRASDLHIEPIWHGDTEQVLMRIRIDGKLRELCRLPIALHESIVMEWKRRAGLAIEERSRPQDGEVRWTHQQALASFRLSIVPTLYGEKVALRTIPNHVPSLDELGLTDTPLKEWLLRWQGLVLFTGPTGSGKSTTLAAGIKELVPHGVNIITVEDPVEYRHPEGVTQLKVEHFTSDEGLRAVMQQDPDVILVGELRGNRDVAQRAVWAAETGHLVLTTMHTHDAVAPLYHFLEWEVKRSLLASNVTGIVNQRLLGKLCPACKAPVTPDAALLDDVRAVAAAGGYDIPEEAVFYGPVGCAACGGGYAGRFALHEYFTFTPALRAAFLCGTAQDAFTRLVRESGQRSSFAAGIKVAVEDGITALEEVLRKVPRWRE